VVRNSFELNEDERLIVVTGPNQGGKTTFARMFGQLHHLASLGCPVPAHSARLGLVDDIFTLFERQEDAGSDRGKLQDDLVRMRHILDNATELSVVVLNEMFSSTTTDDALDLATRVLNPLLDRRCRGICVTFLDELADYRAGVVSMVADVDRDDPGRRLFTLSRRPADGRAYTESLVAKYQLSPYDIKRRVLR
jgi:DNA mismatch repair ATPase MutS